MVNAGGASAQDNDAAAGGAQKAHTSQPQTNAVPSGYRISEGSTLDRAMLLKTMRCTYQELYPQQSFDHLAQTVEAYFSSQTPLWWIEQVSPVAQAAQSSHPAPNRQDNTPHLSPPPGLVRRHHPEHAGGHSGGSHSGGGHSGGGHSGGNHRIGSLWMGTATDQVSGLRHAHIFLLYVQPEHRRKGLGRALMHQAEAWAAARGDRQISLQVFNHNAAALNLYQGLGYRPQSLALVKSLERD